MRRPRVVPALLCDGEDLVITRRFAPYRYAGDVANALRVFNEKEADELLLLDISASRAGRRPDPGLLRDWSAECFMPLTFGGGIGTVEQAESVLRTGVERIALTSAASPELIAAISASSGSQSVVAGVEAVPDGRGGYCVAHPGPIVPLADRLRVLRDAGAGEILVHARDRDGTLAGYDLGMARAAAAAVDVPVMLLGGCSGLPDMRAAFAAGIASAAVGARFCLHGRLDAVLITYPGEAEILALAP